ncbi:MAG: aromatic-ring-hydroxylating dioxygenase subunit beta [Acetobacter aceti]|uniref:Aromatic-ring-hydroxylating dioxygenase subunit beta n=1 Tax=Acetobacter aceti TaxID=435 RepID=A0A1U9KDM0_ACEAC|nr:aromatic-ring-hydroxylating dioxygenase subunit beta [Acetobacter aceti]AQS83848.1 hypothetical protein A0U92_02610 [Acetobacter aceti]
MSIALDQAIELVTQEADLLDHGEFTQWLSLYTTDGLYIVPIDPSGDDFEKTLNYAYDNAHMRKLRVQRLLGGRAISAMPPARTVRLLGRYRLLDSSDTWCKLRCAQILTELRQGRERYYAANITFVLVQTDTGLKIDRKIIRLLTSTEALTAVSYIL